MKRSEVRENRQKWIDFLKEPGRRKAKNLLQSVNDTEARCCLGHACVVFGIESKKVENSPYFIFDGEYAYAPYRVVEHFGLHDREGHVKDGSILWNDKNYISLSELNDFSKASPREIGEYLETVIEGGENTPFVSLLDYEE